MIAFQDNGAAEELTAAPCPYDGEENLHVYSRNNSAQSLSIVFR